MSNELQAHRLRQVVRELRDLDRLINERHRHVGFLRSVSKNLDARDLLALASQLQNETRSLQLFLSGLEGSGRNLAASVGSRPPQETALGRFTPSVGGEIAEIRALSTRLWGQLNQLNSELSVLQIESNSRMNDPGRWGDAALQNPVNELVGFLQNVLDLIRRVKGT